jgi:hypothetical protein
VARTAKTPVAASASASREGSGVPVKRVSQAVEPGDRDKNKVGTEMGRIYRVFYLSVIN